MADLKKIRENIENIDKEMARLFESRMKHAKEVAMYKKENGLAIEDKNREKALIEKNVSFIESDTIKEYYINFLNDLMNISKNYQYRLLHDMKVAYCGVEGAYAHIALKKAFKTACPVSYSSFSAAYKSVEEGINDALILPIENSYAGDVVDVLDLIFSGSLYINNIVDLDISHNLLVKKGTKIEQVKTVCSHPQALMQCADFIEKYGFKKVECSNTAQASLDLSNDSDNSKAVIASSDTAKLYDLEVLKSNINTSRNNTTRFAVFSRMLNNVSSDSKVGNHFILVFTVLNEAGSLAKALNIIGAHGFNMRNLRSRPMKDLMWNYYFFIELDGNINTRDGKDMMNELSTICDCLKLVGTYCSHMDK